jgi:iron complex outermembrane receptor protein
MGKSFQAFLLATASLGATAVQAQDPAPTPTGGEAAPPEHVGAADIVVTAQRRSQNLLSVPLSITAPAARR